MDQQKIIHLVGETIVVGGLFIYLQRQLKNMEREVNEIKETMIKQQQFVEKNFIGISKTIDFLMSQHKPLTSRQIRPSKNKLNIVPIENENDVSDKLFEEIMMPTTNTIFIQSVHPSQESSTNKSSDITVIDDDVEDIQQKIDDDQDIMEELSQLESQNIISSNEDQKIQESFESEIREKQEENIQEEINQKLNETYDNKKTKNKKVNLKTKK
jgi:hypothetical protein